jgi:SWI/SNF-related matrix-associated actin-dependent regulator of chromatin subfamily A-like protein 1
MPIPRPHQIEGARFLADRKASLLADQPRVGKTGAAIMAADYVLADTILVVTTSSGRPVWRRAMAEWSPFGRKVQIVKDNIAADTQVAIVSWGAITQPNVRSALLRRKWCVLILDEAHFAKSFSAKRTQAVYGVCEDDRLMQSAALAAKAERVWPLTGTPAPNSPLDLYPHLRALRPECLRAHDGMPDVTREQDFMDRYTRWRPKKLNPWTTIKIVMGGKNGEELRRRIGDFVLLRTQADVGITEPIYEIMPLTTTATMRRQVEGNVDSAAVLAAAEAGSTKDLEMHLGPLRRLTGELKAKAVAAAVAEEFECGLDKIVLAYWHKDVGAILREALSKYGVVGIDGTASANDRESAEQRFLHDPSIRVFLGQIQAAGEAIDLSSAAELLFVEASFQPAHMKQMSLRITNHSQTRLPRVRVAVLEGSLDEAVQSILLRKWASIREVLPT